MKQKSIKDRTDRGMTLIECIVAISVLVIAATGALTLAAYSIRTSQDARSEFIATHLAEEALEAVHNIRSNNSAGDPTPNHEDWMEDIIDRCDQQCILDVTEHDPGEVWNVTALGQCPGGNCNGRERVYYNPETGLYRQHRNPNALNNSPWVPSFFTRTILVEGVDDANDPKRQVHVTATVTYRGYAGIRTVEISEDLYNWFPLLEI